MNPTKQYELSLDNLIPMYLIEDKLKQNFRKINTFMEEIKNNSITLKQEIHLLKQSQKEIKIQQQKNLNNTQKKIITQISQEMEGRITVALNKRIDQFKDSMEQKEIQLAKTNDNIVATMNNLKKEIRNEILQQNQKSINKQLQKINKKIKNSFTKIAQNQQGNEEKESIEGIRNESNVKRSNENDNGGWQSMHRQIKELEQKMSRLEQFNIGFDKRYHQSMSSLRENWKEIGVQMLENKKQLGKKVDEIKLQLLRLKNMKEFNGMPQPQISYQHKIADNFANIYQAINLGITKIQFQTFSNKINKSVSRHEESIDEIRVEQSKNNDYFTFYAENADSDDLSKQIKMVKETMLQDKQIYNDNMKQTNQNTMKVQGMIEMVGQNLGGVEIIIERLQQQMNQSKNNVVKLEGYVRDVEKLSTIGPDKMAKIHNTLDLDFTANERQLIMDNRSLLSSEKRQIKAQLNKIKDQMYLLAHAERQKHTQSQKLKKQFDKLQTKIQKLKTDTEEALLARKPWVCLSCNRNDDKQLKKDLHSNSMSKKKIDNHNRIGGGFFAVNKHSDKNIKPQQERFEVYEMFKEKYLSDTVKLPELYRQKFGDKEISSQLKE